MTPDPSAGLSLIIPLTLTLLVALGLIVLLLKVLLRSPKLDAYISKYPLLRAMFIGFGVAVVGLLLLFGMFAIFG